MEHRGLERGMLTEQSGLERGMLLVEQSALERGMLTGDTERTGEGNVDWRNRADWRAEC